jgi:hypothetical protein
MAQRERRWSHTQMMRIVEGAEMMASATGLSTLEIINLVAGEPVEEIDEAQDEKAKKKVEVMADDSQRQRASGDR